MIGQRTAKPFCGTLLCILKTVGLRDLLELIPVYQPEALYSTNTSVWICTGIEMMEAISNLV